MMGYGYGNMMNGYGYTMMGGYGNGFGFINFIVTLIIVFAVYKLIMNGKFIKIDKRNNALEILNQRYVKGEIDEQEYVKMRNALTSK